MSLNISFTTDEPKIQELIDLFEFPKDSTITVKIPSINEWEIERESDKINWSVLIPTPIYNYINNMNGDNTFIANNGFSVRCRPECNNQASSDILWLNNESNGNTQNITDFSDWRSSYLDKYKVAFEQINNQFAGPDKIIYSEEITVTTDMHIKLFEHLKFVISFNQEKKVVKLRFDFIGKFNKTIDISLDKTDKIIELITPICIKKFKSQEYIWSKIVSTQLKN